MLTLSGSFVAASSAGKSPGSGCASLLRTRQQPQFEQLRDEVVEFGRAHVEPPAVEPDQGLGIDPGRERLPDPAAGIGEAEILAVGKVEHHGFAIEGFEDNVPARNRIGIAITHLCPAPQFPPVPRIAFHRQRL